MYFPRSVLVVFLCAISLVQPALGESFSVAQGTCIKYTGASFKRDHRSQVKISTEDFSCLHYKIYADGSCFENQIESFSGSLADTKLKCVQGYDPKDVDAAAFCASFSVTSVNMTQSSVTETEYNCFGYTVYAFVRNTCTRDVDVTVTDEDLGNVQDSLCDFLNDVEDAANTVLIIIIVVIASAVVCGTIGCCFCCSCCPLYKKGCCAPKEVPPAVRLRYC
eukprot:2913360-Pyramimonas_sp.AAC.1